MKKTLLLLSLAVARISLGQQVVDLCDLLNNMEAWNGKLVQVRGVMKISSGGGEGEAYLSPPVCDVKIRVTDLTMTPILEEIFPNGIQLTDPQSRTATHKVDFRWDKKNWDRYANAINRIDRESQYIKLTAVGVFETRAPMSRLMFRGTQTGFGHAGYLPGQILVKTIEDIVVGKK